jgi:hypothetical protein
MTRPFPQLAEKHMAEIGVEIIGNDRVVGHEGGVVTLKSGTHLIPATYYSLQCMCNAFDAFASV